MTSEWLEWREAYYGEQERRSFRRKLTNALGVLVLIILAIVMAFVFILRSLAVKETEQLVDDLGHDFAQGNSEVVMEWARGEVVDSWENQVVLVQSDSSAVQFVSKGPDGEMDTDDDIVGEVHQPPKKILPRPPKKGVMTRIKSFFKRE